MSRLLNSAQLDSLEFSLMAWTTGLGIPSAASTDLVARAWLPCRWLPEFVNSGTRYYLPLPTAGRSRCSSSAACATAC